MTPCVHIIDGPLPPSPHPAPLAEGPPLPLPGAGAVVCFEGVVRPTEQGRPLAALDYEVYEPMTTWELEQLARATAEDHGLCSIEVRHSRGRVPAGACSFRLRVTAPHRKQALAAMDSFIDRMKREVPIWKTPVWADGDQAAEPA